MTEKVRDHIDLCVGLIDLKDTMEKEEFPVDERAVEYSRMIRASAKELTEAEADYLDKVPHAVDAVSKSIYTAAQMAQKMDDIGGISELAAKFMVKAGISGHDCDNCNDKGKCEMEATVREEKAK